MSVVNKQHILTIIISITIIVLLLVFLAHNYIKSNIASGGQSINKFLSDRCNDPAVLDPSNFPWTKPFEKDWKLVQKEFLQYCEKYEVPRFMDISGPSAGFNPAWKSIFLRVFNNDTEIITDFPVTKRLIDSCPCTSAYFSMIEPKSKLAEHRGIYKGVIRAHLGLIVPKKWKKCFIVVDGNKLHWQEGKMMMFDDMFLHRVENNTDERRVVLFLDIKRDFKSSYLNAINTVMMRYITCNDALLEAVGKANKLTKKTFASPCLRRPSDAYARSSSLQIKI